ncbi:MAG: ribosome small subunit-dependent GTPase A [Bacillota bacterium]
MTLLFGAISGNRAKLMLKGVVVKAYGGYYYVHGEGQDLECTLRGKFKGRDQVLVGDQVLVEALAGGKGVVAGILPRRSVLPRPRIANVDLVAIVAAFREPEPVLNLVDRMLIQAEAAHLGALIVLNKHDLVLDEPRPEWLEAYRAAGYRAVVTSTVTGEGVPELENILKDRVSVFAGPSGVGKSSLINLLVPGARLPTGDISRKLRRGRHTTRHAELLRLRSGGLVADAPGFSSLALPEVPPEELASLFPEMRDLIGRCRFNSCLHYREPGCAVKSAVAEGKVADFRYRHYQGFLEEIISRGRR